MHIFKDKYFLVVFLAVVLSSLLYSIFSPKVYQSQARVALRRMHIEHPSKIQEDLRNRWIWIRDGLALKSMIVNDSFVNKYRQDYKLAKGVQGQKELASMLKIDFTGADEFNIVVTVRARSSKMAYDIAIGVLERVRYLAVDWYQEAYLSMRANLLKLQNEVSSKEVQEDYLKKIYDLDFYHTLEQEQRLNGFSIIIAPLEDRRPVWPRKIPIIGLALVLGVFAGIFTACLKQQLASRK